MSHCTLEPTVDVATLLQFVWDNPRLVIAYTVSQTLSLYLLSRANSSSRLNGFQRLTFTLVVTCMLFALRSGIGGLIGTNNM